MRQPSGPEIRDGSPDMFDTIARRYDLLNRLLSMGLDRGWRRRAAWAVEPRPGDRILDVATGTADLALAIARVEPGVAVTGVDPAASMLEVGRRKVASRGLAERVVLESGDALELPFENRSFDGATIAFGIRNMPQRERVLRELERVVRPGRRVVVLELTEPKQGLLGGLARLHIQWLVPQLGGLLSGRRAYRHLRSSIAAFPSPHEFGAEMESAGLEVERMEPLTFGVCHLFVGRVPVDSVHEEPGGQAGQRASEEGRS